MSAMPPAFCPYKGLQPYTEQDRAFFFGRDRDQQIVISNLYASQLTVFYGASGVGKSSVLLAGAVPLLKQERNLAVVVFRNWQSPHFLSELKKETLKSVNQAAGREIEVDLSLPLDDFLEQARQALRGPIFIILDQFEEYFLYNSGSSATETFESEFARTVNRKEVNINFLLSMREDGLSKLDRFQGRIPTLLNNLLRLEHLDTDAARDAITKPLDEYNRRLPAGQERMNIEPSLVEAVLHDLQGVKVTSEQSGEAPVAQATPEGQAAAIETPFLQMVLIRLWDEERAANSPVLRLQTFETLGRAENIARTHLDTEMSKLTDAEHKDAASILRYLVTPAGTKIAQEAGALVSWTELDEKDVQATLTRLSAPDIRILRTIQTPGQPTRYEIFHDVLAKAIFDWRGRYAARQQEEKIRREEQERREEEQLEAERTRERQRSRVMRIGITGLSVLLLIMLGLLVWALVQRNWAIKATEEARRAAVEINKKNIQLEAEKHLRSGVVFSQRKKYDDAVREYDEAIKLDPSNTTAHSYKGYALIRAGKYPEAIATLENLTSKVDPSFVWGHYNLALAYWGANKGELAIKAAKKVLEIEPNYCVTFKGDPSYSWFTNSDAYRAQCQR